MAKVDTTDWGTPKRVARATIYSTAPVGAGTVTVSASSYVPVGTKAIRILVVWVTNTAARTCSVEETGTGVGRFVAITAVANQTAYAHGEIQLDSSYQFDLTFNGGATSLNVLLTAVYL